MRAFLQNGSNRPWMLSHFYNSFFIYSVLQTRASVSAYFSRFSKRNITTDFSFVTLREFETILLAVRFHFGLSQSLRHSTFRNEKLFLYMNPPCIYCESTIEFALSLAIPKSSNDIPFLSYYAINFLIKKFSFYFFFWILCFEFSFPVLFNTLSIHIQMKLQVILKKKWNKFLMPK